MTLTTGMSIKEFLYSFQMPVRSMTLTTKAADTVPGTSFQMPVRSMTLTTLECVGHAG